MVPEARKLQMVVVKTKEEADEPQGQDRSG